MKKKIIGVLVAILVVAGLFIMNKQYNNSASPNPEIYSGKDNTWSASLVVSQPALLQGEYNGVFTLSYHASIPKHPPTVTVEFGTPGAMTVTDGPLAKTLKILATGSIPPTRDEKYWVVIHFSKKKYDFQLISTHS